MRWLLVLLVVAGCSKKEPAGPPPEEKPPQIPQTELKRGQDACGAYVAKICACTVPDAARQCGLAKALPDAITTGLEVAQNPESTRRDVLQSNDVIRKTMKECIEQTAKLPALGCD
ncbi:MAG: hypothetical protein IPQ07_34195 [Myxococcales bacterium]|nr:hypothetical protein [Myxococcales bacterium]